MCGIFFLYIKKKRRFFSARIYFKVKIDRTFCYDPEADRFFTFKSFSEFHHIKQKLDIFTKSKPYSLRDSI